MIYTSGFNLPALADKNSISLSFKEHIGATRFESLYKFAELHVGEHQMHQFIANGCYFSIGELQCAAITDSRAAILCDTTGIAFQPVANGFKGRWYFVKLLNGRFKFVEKEKILHDQHPVFFRQGQRFNCTDHQYQ